MLRNIVAVIILAPIAALIVLFAVANRAPVIVGLDPFGSEPPMFAVSLPLFLVLLIPLILGVMIGGVAAWMRQSKWRARARRLAADLKAARGETEMLRRQLEAAAAAPAQPSIASIAYRHSTAA